MISERSTATGAVVYEVLYTRDNLGRITKKVVTAGGVAKTYSYINQLRYELWGAALGAEEGHFSGFMDEPSRETKPEKYLPNLAASVLYAVN